MITNVQYQHSETKNRLNGQNEQDEVKTKNHNTLHVRPDGAVPMEFNSTVQS